MYITQCYLYEQYHSNIRWKSAEEVDAQLKEINGKGAKLKAVKQNINIYVIGQGWSDLHTPWSKNGVDCSLTYLTNHLKMILQKLPEREVKPPTISLPSQKKLKELGMSAAEVQELDKNLINETRKLQRNTASIRRQKEADGEFDRFANIQPFVPPDVDETLIGTRLDVLCLYADDETNENTLVWCQGKVIQVSDGKNLLKDPMNPSRAKTAYIKKGQAAVIRWTPGEGEEHGCETVQYLPKNIWNKKVEGSWRLDVKPFSAY